MLAPPGSCTTLRRPRWPCRWSAKVFVVLALGILPGPPAAAAQPGKPARIGFQYSSPSARPHYIAAFRQGLRELGYVEGQNIVIEFGFDEGKPDRIPAVTAELVRREVDVIVAASSPRIVALKRATRTIPIVMVATPDPVALGFVSSLARPGGNITGLSTQALDLGGKQLQLLQEVVPRVSRVAVLHNAANPQGELVFREMEGAARTLGVGLHSLAVREPAEFEGAFAAAIGGRAGGLITVDDTLLLVHGARIVALAAKSRLPTMHTFRDLVEDGGLMAYGPSLLDLFRRAASYVDKILKGAKPADLPVEQPMRFELVINMKTARALGITFPPSIMVRADQVIQ